MTKDVLDGRLKFHSKVVMGYIYEVCGAVMSDIKRIPSQTFYYAKIIGGNKTEEREITTKQSVLVDL